MGNTVTKAKLLVETGETIQVDINPTEYQLDSSIQYTEKNVPGLNTTIGQYVGGNSQSLSLCFYFDTYQPPTLENPTEGGSDVSEKTKEIANLTMIDGTLHRIPEVTFSWGSLNFSGVITSVREHYTMFLADGMPVRAKVDVTFKSSYDKEGKRTSPFESPDRTKVRTLLQGEALWSIAAEEYGDAEMWRVIAQENGILNPLKVSPGQILRLPPL